MLCFFHSQAFVQDGPTVTNTVLLYLASLVFLGITHPRKAPGLPQVALELSFESPTSLPHHALMALVALIIGLYTSGSFSVQTNGGSPPMACVLQWPLHITANSKRFAITGLDCSQS